MRFRTVLAPLSATLLLLTPLAAHAAIPFFGPIIPAAYNTCPASWGLLIQVINNIISLLITLAIVFVAPIMIMWAGFLYVVNPVKPDGIKSAKKMLYNTVVGIVVALASWIIVDAVMAVFYHPSDNSGWTKTWSDIVTGNLKDVCVKQEGATTGGLNQAPALGTSANGALNTPPAGKAGTPCDPSRLLAGATAAGTSLTTTQANIFACIAQWESRCSENPSPPNYSWNILGPEGKASTAAGAFQVLLASNASCYENQACYDAVGQLRSPSPLNCAAGFNAADGTIKDKAKVEICLRAANNLNCSISAAVCLLNKNGGKFSPWQKDKNSSKQTACINSGGQQ